MISDGEVLLAPGGHSELVSSAPDKASNSDSRIASSMVEQETLNLLVVGSSPTRCTIDNQHLATVTSSKSFFMLALSLHFFG